MSEATMKNYANTMIQDILAENMPNNSVVEALKSHRFNAEKVHLVAIGKAAWSMSYAASEYLGDKIAKGVVITKYDHSQGNLPNIEIIEAGHPIPDENTIKGTQKALDLVANLTAEDEVLFLISGGGSALFEAPVENVSLADLANLTDQLLASGADITEMNTIRKRFSRVKAGRFAQACQPAKVFAIVLSDVLGDKLDTIASGPAAPDSSTVEEVLAIVDKYNLKLTDVQKEYLHKETPKSIENVETVVTGSVQSLCNSAAKSAEKLGFKPYVLTTTLNCEASEAGRMFASIAQDTQSGVNYFEKPCAIIAGGETIVNLKGTGKGGRNQEMALATAIGIENLEDTLFFSLGSDGTDGPTDAAGGMVTGQTVAKLKELNHNPEKILANNDAYHGLQAADGLIVTGPTGTNVNDVSVILCK